MISNSGCPPVLYPTRGVVSQMHLRAAKVLFAQWFKFGLLGVYHNDLFFHKPGPGMNNNTMSLLELTFHSVRNPYGTTRVLIPLERMTDDHIKTPHKVSPVFLKRWRFLFLGTRIIKMEKQQVVLVLGRSVSPRVQGLDKVTLDRHGSGCALLRVYWQQEKK